MQRAMPARCFSGMSVAVTWNRDSVSSTSRRTANHEGTVRSNSPMVVCPDRSATALRGSACRIRSAAHYAAADNLHRDRGWPAVARQSGLSLRLRRRAASESTTRRPTMLAAHQALARTDIPAPIGVAHERLPFTLLAASRPHTMVRASATADTRNTASLDRIRSHVDVRIQTSNRTRICSQMCT